MTDQTMYLLYGVYDVSGSEGIRLEEAKKINMSISALGMSCHSHYRQTCSLPLPVYLLMLSCIFFPPYVLGR